MDADSNVYISELFQLEICKEIWTQIYCNGALAPHFSCYNVFLWRILDPSNINNKKLVWRVIGFRLHMASLLTKLFTKNDLLMILKGKKGTVQPRKIVENDAICSFIQIVTFVKQITRDGIIFSSVCLL